MTSIIPVLKQNNQDFEFFPTTAEILQAVSDNIFKEKTKDLLNDAGELVFDDYTKRKMQEHISILDICAGNGSALMQLKSNLTQKGFTHISLSAIEKSFILYSLLDDDIALVGTDYFAENMINKKADIVFCNPPFSQTEEWFKRLLTTTPACVKDIYFVCPSKQGLSKKYQTMFDEFVLSKGRKGEYTMSVLQNKTFSFTDGERSARVDAVVLHLSLKSKYEYSEKYDKDSLFSVHFPELETKLKKAGYSSYRDVEEDKNQQRRDLVVAQFGDDDIVKVLVEEYQMEYNEFMDAYSKLNEVPLLLLRKLDIDLYKAKELLFGFLTNLETRYWRKLFELYQPLREKLTSVSIKKLMDYVQSRNFSFTYANCLAVTVFAVKQTNRLLIEQVLTKYKHWAEVGNYHGYKSNQRLFDEGRFKDKINPDDIKTAYHATHRWTNTDIENIMPFTVGERKNLEYRIVDVGLTFEKDRWTCVENSTAWVACNDLMTIAKNFGYDGNLNIADTEHGKRYTVHGFDRNNNSVVLFEYKVFKNGNAHFFINKDFMIDIMLSVGKYLGWVHSKEQAMQDLDITSDEYDNAIGNLPQIANSLDRFPALPE